MMKIKSFISPSSKSRISGFEPEDRGASPWGETNFAGLITGKKVGVDRGMKLLVFSFERDALILPPLK